MHEFPFQIAEDFLKELLVFDYENLSVDLKLVEDCTARRLVCQIRVESLESWDIAP